MTLKAAYLIYISHGSVKFMVLFMELPGTSFYCNMTIHFGYIYNAYYMAVRHLATARHSNRSMFLLYILKFNTVLSVTPTASMCILCYVYLLIGVR